MINTKLQNIIDTKSAIGNAIVNKGGTITSETPFFNYAAQIDGISTGTPQTIFQASDGSKWALTNVVNLTNVSNNVTYDFNRWQLANNSTSDPILNVGTVGANISGNIRLVPVNQVNIAQYENIVINDTTGAKYVGYNGFDSSTNPTPTGNTTFNRWLLNNSATGTVLFANTTVVNGGIYNGPNAIINEANMAFVNNTVGYGATPSPLAINDGFIYVGGAGNATANRNIKKYHEDNLVFVSNSNIHINDITHLLVSGGFIYTHAGGQLRKYNESTLAFSALGNLGRGLINSMTLDASFIYVGVQSSLIKRFQSNLAFSLENEDTVNGLQTMNATGGFVFGGTAQGDIRKFHTGNLVQSANVATGLEIQSSAVNNGFVYVGSISLNQPIGKYHQSNLAFVANSPAVIGRAERMTTGNGFVYITGSSSDMIQKFYESNLAFVGNTALENSQFNGIAVNSGFIYSTYINSTSQSVYKYSEKQFIPDNQTFYTATKIKE